MAESSGHGIGGGESWCQNSSLKDDLKKYVQQNLKRREILDFMKSDYSCYAWSIATLDRRLGFFYIRYIDSTKNIADVTAAVQKEMEGPGRLLGYRAINQKLRTEYNICVPRQIVYNAMWNANPEILEARSVKKKRKPPKKLLLQMAQTGLCH